MNYRTAFWFPVSVLALLAGLSLWLQYAVQSPGMSGPDQGKHIADNIVENFHATRYDSNGRPENTLNARKTQHFLDDDSTGLDTPHFTATDPQNGHVDIRSETGYVSSEGETVTFTGNVVLVRDMRDAQGPLTLTTDYLEIFPDQHLARTNRPVQVRGKSLAIDAGGFQMNNQTRELRLNRGVKTYYEPIH